MSEPTAKASGDSDNMEAFFCARLPKWSSVSWYISGILDCALFVLQAHYSDLA